MGDYTHHQLRSSASIAWGCIAPPPRNGVAARRRVRMPVRPTTNTTTRAKKCDRPTARDMSMHVYTPRVLFAALSKADRRHGIRRDGSPLGNAALVGLRLLALLRTTSPIALAGSMLLVPAQYRDGVSNRSIALLFMVLVVFALFTWRLVARAPRVSQWQLFRHAHLDILALTAMLYMTGGTNNPFAPLFLLLMPVAVTVTALRPSLIWTTFATTLLAYFCVRWSTAPTANNMIGPAWFTLHEDGMLANYVTIATVLVFYLTRTIRAVILREQLLSESRLAQTRSETVVALGALAAGYAHELGTPLGTIAIVVGELKRTHGANPHAAPRPRGDRVANPVVQSDDLAPDASARTQSPQHLRQDARRPLPSRPGGAGAVASRGAGYQVDARPELAAAAHPGGRNAAPSDHESRGQRRACIARQSQRSSQLEFRDAAHHRVRRRAGLPR